MFGRANADGKLSLSRLSTSSWHGICRRNACSPSAVSITGEVKYYEVTGDSGSIVGRGFCPICGSRLFSKPPSPELMGIMAGSLDDPSWFQPMMDFYTSSAQPWDFMNPDLPKFTKLPHLDSK
jgi:hypothetical protein